MIRSRSTSPNRRRTIESDHSKKNSLNSSGNTSSHTIRNIYGPNAAPEELSPFSRAIDLKYPASVGLRPRLLSHALPGRLNNVSNRRAKKAACRRSSVFEQADRLFNPAGGSLPPDEIQKPPACRLILRPSKPIVIRSHHDVAIVIASPLGLGYPFRVWCGQPVSPLWVGRSHRGTRRRRAKASS